MPQVNESDLLARTIRTAAILVGACILFVGVLSVAAVAITAKAVGGPAHEGAGERVPAALNPARGTPPPPSPSGRPQSI